MIACCLLVPSEKRGSQTRERKARVASRETNNRRLVAEPGTVTKLERRALLDPRRLHLDPFGLCLYALSGDASMGKRRVLSSAINLRSK